MEQVKFTVTDIKQYTYCPRLIYYKYCQPVHRKITFKMENGQQEHNLLEEREQRRTLKRYNLDEGERFFKLKLSSDRLSLSGILDMMIKTPSELIPVEFKYSTHSLGLSYKYQLTAYALLLEEQYNQPVRRGMIYLIPLNEIHPFDITATMREYIGKTIKDIRRIISTEYFPDLKSSTGRCNDCEYLNYCGDV